MINLKTPVAELTRVGKTTAKQMEKLGIKTINDLLTHYPFRYDDYSNILNIKELKTAKTGTIRAKINFIANHRSFKKKMIITEAIVSDQTDSIKVIWFNQPFLTKFLKTGSLLYLAGKIDYDDYYGLQLTNPSYELCQEKIPIHTGRLVPIYPSTAKLTQKQIRFLIRQAILLTQKIEDWLPREIRIKNNLINLSFALEQIHFPQNKKWLEKAAERLKFDELFLLQIKGQIIRKKIRNCQAPIIKFNLKQTQKFVQNLPFKLTNAQRKASWEIINDLEKSTPMNRLLEGEVGSGKTVVATIGILNALLSGYQVAYMAPTEILADQHFKTISELLKLYNFKIALLTRGQRKTNFKEKIKKALILKLLASKKIGLIIGTHSLIQEKIKFDNLGLVIIDEQHRFGVSQRAALLSDTKNTNTLECNSRISSHLIPHFLSMTATPIPRSMALTLYNDLDLSIIDQLPINRKKIITKIIPSEEADKMYLFIKQEIKKGRQVFVICPLIDPSDKLGVKSVKEEYKKLSEKIFPDFRIALLHGKMKSEQKEKIISAFAKSYNKSYKNLGGNKIDILISTTVVEVGIDVPNASVMIIEGAERFGLAQLYQLRGRVGRGEYQSYCFLLMESGGEAAKKRLQALLSAKNGFELAEKDLELRGPGELFGVEQAGFFSDFKIAKFSDTKIIKQSREAIKQIFEQKNWEEKYPLLKNKISESIKTTHLE